MTGAPTPAAERKLVGRPWQKGVSGNPGGRSKTTKQLAKLAREYTDEALATVVSIMRDEGNKPIDRLRAADIILDRGYGKAKQKIELEDAALAGPVLADVVAELVSDPGALSRAHAAIGARPRMG